MASEAIYTNKIFLCGALPLLKTIVADVPSLNEKFKKIHCVYQVSCLDPDAPLGKWDVTAFVLALFFLTLETVADEYQWKFH